MKEKIKSLFVNLQLWQIIVLSVLGAILITDSITAILSLWIWHEIQLNLIVLGTINAILVPLIILPTILRNLRYVVRLEEQNRSHLEIISQLASERQIEATLQRRADEMSLLYQLGILFAAGKNLYDTLLILQTEIIKLVQVDTLFVAIYNERTDIVDFPIFFRRGEPQPHSSRRLGDRPGLTGGVIYSKKTLYLPDMLAEAVIAQYAPVGDTELILRTFLGIPLMVHEKVIGVLSVQSIKMDAYSKDQIQLIENVAVQAATAMDKANLLDQVKQELAERKRAENQLHEREIILEAITFAGEQFLKTPDWRVNIDRVLERLGQTLNATHAYLFEDHLNAEGEPVTSMRYEWTAAGYPSDLDSSYFQNAPIHKDGFEDQVEALLRGDVRAGNSSTFNPVEKASMDEFGVKSILEVPISVNEKIWGAIGFDDFEQEREWSNGEVEALKIAAGVLSAAIQREKAESAVRESERIYRQAIEAAGAVPYYQDYKFDTYQFIGQRIQEITGYTPEEITSSLWNRITQEQELVGEVAGMDVDEVARRVRLGELDYWRSDVRIRTKNGQSKWIADSAIELFDASGVSYASIGIMQDITERKQIEASLRQREAMLEATTYTAEQFLKTSDWRLNIDKVLERLGKTFHVTHAYLFEHFVGTDEVEYSALKYEWTAAGHTSDSDNPYYQKPNPIKLGADTTDHVLRQGQIFIGTAATFPRAERERLLQQGVKAMVELPVFVEEKWWGTFGIDDYENEREWNNAEVDALKIAVGILGAAIQRQDAESAVRESERIYRQAIEAADAVPYYLDYKSNSYLFMGEGIREMTGFRSGEVSPQIWLDIVQETVLLGEAEGLSVDEAFEFARQGRLKSWKCDQKIIRRDGQVRWLTDRSIELFDGEKMSYGSIGILQDITDRKLTEASLRQREAILEAVTFAAEQFLKTSDWRLNIDHVLERLGKTFHATHAYLFEHHAGIDDLEYSTLKAEWTAAGHPSDFDNPYYQSPNRIKLDEGSTDHFLRRGQIFIGTASTFPANEKERLLELGVKAMVEVPLFVDGEWWGTFGLDDFETERNWNNAEVDALKIAVGILSAAIQRENAEAAVRESEHIYRQAIEAAGAVPYYIDYKSGRYLFMGDGIRQMIGYEPEEMSLALWRQNVQETIMQGEAAGFSVAEAAKLVQEGKIKIWRSDVRFQTRAGQQRWLSDSGIEIFGDQSLSYAAIGILQDITDRKLTEANLRKRESILEAATFAAEQFLKTANWRERIEIVLERLGKEMDASHAYLFEKHTGPDGVVLSSMVYEWIAPGCKSDLGDPQFLNMPPQPMGFDRLYDTLNRGEPLVASSSYFTPAEQEYMQTIHVRALLEMRVIVDGKHWGTIGFDEVRKEREWSAMEVEVIKVAANVLGAAIKRQLDEAALHHELSQRTKLVEELENKNSELERFTYTVSHDLKSPLVTINGFLGFLEQDAVSGNLERLKKDTQRIQEAVNKMQRLLSELLELSRIGRKMNVAEVVSFEELVSEAMNIVHGQLEARGVTVHIQPDLPAVYGDKPRLTEVLQNLLDNAAKYMGGQPQPQVEIGYAGEDPEHGQLIFYVKDNGIGIAPEFHERVFGLFNKLDPKSEGTGVGLALVRRIIEVHSGRIWIESELGQGSTFYFALPGKGESG